MATDTLSNFENLKGSNYNDILTGNAGSNVLIGGLGNDVLNGVGEGYGILRDGDHSRHRESLTGWRAEHRQCGHRYSEKFREPERQQFQQTLTGSAGNNVLSGLAGQDTLKTAGQ